MNIRESINQKLDIVESRPVYTADIINRITPIFAQRVNSMYTADGSVGLFRDHDGQAYEISVKPASLAQYGSNLGTEPQKHAARKQRHKEMIARTHPWLKRS